MSAITSTASERTTTGVLQASTHTPSWPRRMRLGLSALFILLSLVSACKQSEIPEKREDTTTSPVSFNRFIIGGEVKTGVIFDVDLTSAVPWSVADLSATCKDAPNYPTPTKPVTAEGWVYDLHDKWNLSTLFMINSSFFATEQGNFYDGSCAIIMGIAAGSDGQTMTSPDDCKDDTCYPIDAFFVTRVEGNYPQGALVSSGQVQTYFNDHRSNVWLAVGGIIFLKSGKWVPEAALQLHNRDGYAARMALAFGGTSGLGELSVIYFARGEWLETDVLAPGITDNALADLLKKWGYTDAIMLDGGGSATVYLASVANWTGPSEIPINPGRNGYRDVANFIGLTHFDDSALVAKARTKQ